ncbi:hypothetical protein M2404_002905 [Rheinheimera pacifica]|nr:hypothetical protein [Rheinheimera pacifica]
MVTRANSNPGSHCAAGHVMLAAVIVLSGVNTDEKIPGFVAGFIPAPNC